jgi:phospholipid N-methyltransferase
MALFHFLKQFVSQPRTIGAIAPSSSGLAKRMIEQIDFSAAKVLVEYGPGSGVFTKKILENIDQNETIFFGLELNETMNRIANQEVPDVPIYQDSAAEISKYLKQYGVNQADAIISGLPWAAFPENLQDEILEETVASLPEGGTFSTFAYLHGLVLPSGLRFRKKLKKHFSIVKTSPVVWKNVPPALVYWCKK